MLTYMRVCQCCEPNVPRVEHLLDSVLKTYYKLQELGIQEVDGKIIFLDEVEVENG